MRHALSKRFAFWRRRRLPFAVLFKKFQTILERNNQILELMADMGDKLGGEYVFDRHYIEHSVQELEDLVFKLVSDFSLLNRKRNTELLIAFEQIRQAINGDLAGRPVQTASTPRIVPLSAIGLELTDEVGAKMATLGELHNRLGLTVPDGFTITTGAFAEFLATTGLSARHAEAVRYWRDGDDQALRRLAEESHRRLLSAPLPRDLSALLLTAFRDLAKRRDDQGDLKVALRSSATGEDGTSSFAGQYATVLNVAEGRFLEAYRQVVASAFTYPAWRYRLARGYQDYEMAMAVGCQCMVAGTTSGVLQTYAPQQDAKVMGIESIWGLCAPVVNGDCPVDSFLLDRIPPYRLRVQVVAHKPRQLVMDQQSGTLWQDVAADRQHLPSLNDSQLQRLAETAMTLEGFFKRPLEIEWTFSTADTLHILQVRPLSRWSAAPARAIVEAADEPQAEVIFAGRGTIVQCGIAAGRVVLIDSDDDLDRFPHGGILLVRHSSPRYSAIMHKARGIITDIGSSTGHMATIAREFRVPTIVNTEVATSLLQPGELVTLDATRNVVYRGDVSEGHHFDLIEEELFEDSAEYRLLRRVLNHIIPLNLLNPQGEDFVPASCRTCHDITRYIHEKAVEELILLSENHGAAHASAPRRLTADIPIGLLVINAGDGLAGPADAPEVAVDDVLSLPLQALLDGLIHLGMWCTTPVAVDLHSFMSSFTRTFTTALAGPRDIGRNLAVVMRHYMNINLRLGYHYTTIDAYIAETINDNYIYFRFLGGVTEFIRRSRRAACIARVLEHFDFRVEIHGDLVVGRLKKQAPSRMRDRMRMLGALLCYTRQLDAQMHSDRDVACHAADFIQAIRNPSGGNTHESRR
ncbi:MAG: PEP/pyruvate-binding domain-containing protein [Desulfoprunum sp.]|uniref:PEP/pyruvate-binding domain-containing protein n=1 Tax=Desulfoprunum sp. TaxID=2020866 RepID=UPI003C78FADC